MEKMPWTAMGSVERLGRVSTEGGDIFYDGANVGGQEVGPFKADEPLADRFAAAVKAGEAKNLHFFPLAKATQLVGFEGPQGLVVDGRSFWMGRLMSALICIFGVLTIPFFGVGLVILFIWWGMFKRSRPAAYLARHTRKLPAAERVS